MSTVTEQHDYIYASGKLLRETVTTTEGSTSTIQTLDFFYDANGTPYALKVNGTTYYYVTNLQGDVVRLVKKLLKLSVGGKINALLKVLWL